MEPEYLTIFKSLNKEQPIQKKQTVLLLDGLNTFIRAFSVVKTINSQGHNIGGLVGFLKSIGLLNRQFRPNKFIVCWDGKGGASARKNINSNYKAQREHASVIHWDIYDNKEDEIDSMNSQIDRIYDYLNYLPVNFVRLPRLEADDTIAYLARKYDKEGSKVIIVSSDKDFLQLVNENINVYSPTKKVMYDYSTTKEFLQVLPENYNIIKSLTGDKSDNLRGVKGIGIKTLLKEIPELGTNPGVTLDTVFEICSEKIGKKLVCSRIIHEWSIVEVNYRLMNLHDTVLNDDEKELVQKMADEEVSLKRGPFLTLLDCDKLELSTKDPEQWLNINFS